MTALSAMLKVYASILPDVSYIPLLYPNLGVKQQSTIMFLNRAFSHMNTPFVELVDTPEEADYILLPHNYPALKNHASYIQQQADVAARLGKKLIVFWHGDSDKPVPYDNAIVFRTSQYRGHQKPHEILMPAYAEDLLQGELQTRNKHAGQPVVGFCGWADYKNFKNRIGTIVKNSLWEATSLVGIRNDARIKGITYRMKAVKHLQSSARIEPNFIIRSSYSGHTSTIKTDPEQTRREYIDNMLNSDYALVVKGDGNYSYRLYEALSLGRIPVLLDTDCILPLEDYIAYDTFMLRVPYYNLYHLDRIIEQHYNSVSETEFIDMQKSARDAFEKYLRVDAFLRFATEQLLPV